MGDIGDNPREIEFEPLPDDAPVKEPAYSPSPEKAPQEEPIPA